MIKRYDRRKIDKRNGLSIILAALCSILLLLIISRGNPWFGVWDDNQTQWLPVMEEAYKRFFQTGRLPEINWFQMKGMKIYDVGYYGLWNPFMASSYLITKALSQVVQTNMITVYIYLMVILGNLSCYGILRQVGIRRRIAVPCSCVMMGTSIYFCLTYWYYIFNVYFILPFLFYFILKEKGKRAYYCHGIILAFSILLGNVQYTVYMCLVYAVFMLLMGIMGEEKSYKKFFTNIAAAGCLMSVYLLMLLLVSGRTLDFSGSNESFYDSVINPVLWCVSAIFPTNLAGSDHSVQIDEWFLKHCTTPGYGRFPQSGGFYLGPLLLAVVIGGCRAIISRHKQRRSAKEKNDHAMRMSKALLLTGLLVLTLSFGKIGITAIFMHQVPFLNSFRILSKFLVLLPPILILPFAIFIKGSVLKNSGSVARFIAVCILIVSFAGGMLQNRNMDYGKPRADASAAAKRAEELGLDTDNYRLTGFASFEEISVIYPEWESFTEKEEKNLNEKISKNAGITGHIFTIGGYDLAFRQEKFEQSKAIMQSASGYGSEYGYANLVIEDYFFPLYENYQSQGEEVYLDRLSLLKKEIRENAVKFFIFSKDSARVGQFEEMLSGMGLPVIRKGDFLKNTLFIEIGGTGSLAMDTAGNKIPLEAEMDRLSFPWKGEEAVRLSLTYDTGIRALFVSDTGEKMQLPTVSDEKGYLLVDGKQASGKSGKVNITYSNMLYTAGKIWTFLFIPLAVLGLYGPALQLDTKRIRQAGTKWRAKACLKTHKDAAQDNDQNHNPDHKTTAGDNKPKEVLAPVLWITGTAAYVLWLANTYLRTSTMEPDELWFQNIFRTIRRGFLDNPAFLFGHTENYLGYGQLYWMAGSLLNPFLLRFAALLSILGTLFLLLKDVKLLFGKKYVPYIGLLWLSMPYAWFTHKISGPELPALFLSVLGVHFILRNHKECRAGRVSLLLNDAVNDTAGWILIGIGAGIKLNYAIFGVFAGVYLLLQRKRDRWTALIKGAVLAGMGMLLANPLILWDFPAFWENMRIDGGMDWNMISAVFENRVTEWDGIMNHGIFYGYISWLLLLIIVVLAALCKDARKIGISLSVSVLLTIVICCRSTFLGWYLLPLLYFIPMLLAYVLNGNSDKSVMKWLRDKRVLLLLLAINFILLSPVLLQERKNDYERIQQGNEDTKEEQAQELERMEEELRAQYPGEKIFCFIDFQAGKYSYSHEEYIRYILSQDNGIGIISRRMQQLPELSALIKNAEEENPEGGGILKLQETEHFIVVRREKE